MTMDDKLRWGILSTARINDALLNPLRVSRRNQLVAVSSRTQDKAEAYARKIKIKRAYGSYPALLADPEIDVIYNPLPNHLHAEWTIKAVQAGKHVLCEKPLALTIQEVDAISGASEKYGKVVAEAFMYRTHAQSLKVKEIVESGKLGKVKLIHGSFTFVMTNPDDYRWNPEMGGGGLWDIGCYPLSFMRMVLSTEPLEVYGRELKGPSGVDEVFAAQMRFPNDIFAHFDCSIKVPFHVFMEIIGDEGTLIIPKPFNPGAREKLFLIKGNKTETIALKGTDPYVSEVEDMSDAILLGRPTRVSLADSRGNVAVIQALFESARTGKPMTM
jgi:Predicted dehydrogenases and related proteins